MMNFRLILVSSVSVILLGACGEDQNDLKAWMATERANAPKPKAKVNEPKKFEPFVYEHVNVKDPFASANLLAALDRASKKDNGIAPDTKRAKEELEGYPLDTLALVGHLHNGVQSVGLVRSSVGVHRVKVGNYLGQNYGLITKLSETEIKVKELVQDAAGEWTEREVSMQLLEKSADSKK